MKSRASFLGGDLEDDVEDSSVRSFKNLQQMTMSPTIGDKTPFSKTPRAKMGADPDEDEEAFKDSTSPRGVKQDKGEKEKEKDKKNLIGKFLSKHRNKK